MKKLLYLLLGIFLLASCQQEELTENQSGYGYLSELIRQKFIMRLIKRMNRGKRMHKASLSFMVKKHLP